MKFNLLERHTLGQLESAGFVTLGRGKVISKIDIANTQGNYPVYSSSATGNGEIGRYGRYMFDDERITWSIDGGGRFFYREPHKYSVTNVCGWMKVNSGEINTKFLHLALTFFWQFKEYDYTHKAHPSVIREEYDRLSFPSLAEQKRIAAELDLITEMIRNREAQLARLDTLVKSKFEEMFGDLTCNPYGWQVKRLAELAIGKLSYGASASAINYDGSVRFVRITDIQDDGSLNNKPVSGSFVEDKFLLNGGDLLLARTGATVGKSYLYRDCDGPCIYAGYLIRVRPNKKITEPIYLKYFTNSRYYWDFVKSCQRVVAQPNINAQEYGDLQVPLPPLSLQKEFAAVVEEIDKAKVAIKKTIENLKTLYKQRLQEYFA